ncbi:DcaP family trimeric outer membrane transporter, partial [Klebsiella pneumoniae]|uniref:DcaP family trimeric outer membrane transporter n=1 Tax=Klebsiella pneumoniae TaxID=573 RepID=UPI00298DD000
RVRHAYMSLGKWLAGQTTSPFVNTDTSPETLDFTGAVGTGTTRTVQVRYTQPINAQQKILVALECGDVEKVSNAAGGSRFPALTTRYDFKTADNKGLLQLH